MRPRALAPLARLAALGLALCPLLLPQAVALDVFPGYDTLGETEARFLVRLPHGGALEVRADPPVDVAVVRPGGAPGQWQRAPTAFQVEREAPEDAWHGLPGTVEVVVRRADPETAVRVELEERSGAGAAFDWPAHPPTPRRWLPFPSPLLVVGSALVAATFMRRKAKHPRMRFEVEAETNAPLEEVWTWWTDYGRTGEERQVNHGFGVPGKRQVVEADGKRVVLAEKLPLPVMGGVEMVRYEVEVDHDAHRLRERALQGLPYESIWTFETTAANRTRIRREMVMEEGPAKHTPAALVKPFTKRDLEHHVKEFERERHST